MHPGILSNFNPRSPYGERLATHDWYGIDDVFQSTLPLRGATTLYTTFAIGCFISIHAPLTGSDHQAQARPVTIQISIHAPLTGSDRIAQTAGHACLISIHAPLTGSDFIDLAGYAACADFNPRSPYGGRGFGAAGCGSGRYFNPRSPYGERLSLSDDAFLVPYFNPRSPYGERPSESAYASGLQRISIHAPLTGSDADGTFDLEMAKNFNPRSPYGERLVLHSRPAFSPIFQSTLPLRGATAVRRDQYPQSGFQSTLPLRGATGHTRRARHQGPISIHAPLTGSDLALGSTVPFSMHFNPRSPYGERPPALGSRYAVSVFQSTLPLRGATIGSPPAGYEFLISIHAPLTGSDVRERIQRDKMQLFQSTLPLRGATRWGPKF